MAIIRPERWPATKAALAGIGLPAFTHRRVLGRGATRGLQYLPRQGASPRMAIDFLPKRLISWVVEDRMAAPLVEALVAANRTGQLGDGRIFVLAVEEAVRLRTGQRGDAALRPAPVAGAARGGDAARG